MKPDDYEAFRFAVELGNRAEEQKRALAAGTLEHEYWQGVTDTCRKFTALMRGDRKFWGELPVSEIMAGSLPSRSHDRT